MVSPVARMAGGRIRPTASLFRTAGLRGTAVRPPRPRRVMAGREGGIPMDSESRSSTNLRDVTHVFLDVGGTLLYSDPRTSDLFHRILTARGHRIDRDSIVRLLRTPESIVTLIRPFQAGREHEFFRAINARVIEHLGFDSDDPLLDEIQSQFRSGVAWKLFPDVEDTLRSLRETGFHLGIISNASHALPETLRKSGLARYFDTVTYSFGVGFEKPDVRIF